MLYKRVCKKCGREFESESPRAWYCNYTEVRKCLECGKEVEVPIHWQEGKDFRCSNSCRTKFQIRTKGDPRNSSKAREKARNTLKKNYGVEFPGQSKKVQEKVRKTNLERYGNTFGKYNSKEEINKRIELYGSPNKPLTKEQKDVMINKCRQTWLKNYGVDHPMKDNKVKEKQKASLRISMNKESTRIKVEKSNLERYGVPYFVLSGKCLSSTNTISNINLQFSNLLNSKGIENKLEFLLNLIHLIFIY